MLRVLALLVSVADLRMVGYLQNYHVPLDLALIQLCLDSVVGASAHAAPYILELSWLVIASRKEFVLEIIKPCSQIARLELDWV